MPVSAQIHPCRHWCEFAAAFVLLVCLFSQSVVAAADAVVGPGEDVQVSSVPKPAEPVPMLDQAGTTVTVRRQLLEQLGRDRQDLEIDALLRFYRRHNPEALAEFEEKCATDRAAAAQHATWLATRFQELEALRLSRPDEFKRCVALEQLESACRRLARRVRYLERALAAGEGNRGAQEAALKAAREDLRDALQRHFVGAQQNQLVELNRLEAEVRELRRMVEERQASKDAILERYYLQLTGATEYVGSH